MYLDDSTTTSCSSICFHLAAAFSMSLECVTSSGCIRTVFSMGRMVCENTTFGEETIVKKHKLTNEIPHHVLLVRFRVVSPEVGQEIAGEHPVQPVEEGVQPHLDVELLHLRQALDVLVAPRGQTTESSNIFRARK